MDRNEVMQRVFSLAKRAEGFVSPNPMVGAIIVKGKRIIGEGYHKGKGYPHAEVVAISNSKESVKGATLYINLEPCCHRGVTPPCVDKIIGSGIKKVVISCIDPNPLVRGKSIRKLRKAGVKVELGILRKEAQRLNEVFFTNMRKKRPFVVIKVAQSLDGKITTANGISKWITSRKARYRAKSLRDKYDAVLVGINTVIKDNPTLSGIKKSPYRVVIDPHLRMPFASKLISEFKERLVIVSTKKADKKKWIYFEKRGIKLLSVPVKSGDNCEEIDLSSLLNKLYGFGITSIFVEGGAFTIGKFFDAKLVDKVYIFIAPKIIGGKESLSSVGGRGVQILSYASQINDIELHRVGKDFLFSGYPVFPS